MRYKISKKKVIEAILTENLRGGHFFYSRTSKDNGKCKVCAVGAILRKTKKLTFDSDDAGSVTDDTYGGTYVDQAYSTNNFLSILSCEFEYVSLTTLPKSGSKYRDELIRMHCLNVIEAFCPDILEFEVLEFEVSEFRPGII